MLVDLDGNGRPDIVTKDDKGQFFWNEAEFLSTYDIDALTYLYKTVIQGRVKLFPEDSTPPIISLLGQKAVSLLVNETYVEEGATAVDDTDGDISSRIIIEGNVDSTRPGEHQILYNASDYSNNKSYEIRTINVRDYWFSNSQKIFENWYYSDWFGYYLMSGDSKWIYHLEHGWIYAEHGAELWYYDPEIGWCFSTADLYPFIYDLEESRWLWFASGSINPRYFYDFDEDAWITVSK